METYRKERCTEHLSGELTQISDLYFLLHCRFPPLLHFLSVQLFLFKGEGGCLFWLLPAHGSADVTHLGGCTLPSCCRCCHCRRCSSWCCSRCGWSRSWATCQPARAEWQIPRCLANQACKKKLDQMGNNSTRLSQHHIDIYVNELRHPQ